ncbi:MAG TPA: cell division protein FtsL [Ramlibacter sp.]|nr:cell division protein FtsL [Ramlibacter sp.]
MMRLNLVLLLAVLASALYLVRVQYDSRRLYAEIEKAQGDFRKLEIEHERLQVQKRAQATPARVEKLAREQLQMRPATPAITQYVRLHDAAAGEVAR